MLLTLVLALGAFNLVSSQTAPKAPYTRTECTKPTQRKPWQALNDKEKQDYINADLCLMSAPPQSGIKGAKSRWDELQYSHIAQSDYIHFVGAFLPFHRYFVTAHGHLLQTECNYTGPLPYWDEPLDVGAIANSSLFRGPLSFGGDGRDPTRCIADGPFANLTLRFHEDLSYSPEYCVSRSMNDVTFSMAARANIENCLKQPAFTLAWQCIEGLPHGAGHAGIMGTMVNPMLSPGDPVFYLHHGYLDKMWWDWQVQNLSSRLIDIGGNNTAAAGFPFGGGGFGFNTTGPSPFNFTAPPGNGSQPFPGFPISNRTINKAFTDYFNDGGPVTTLNHTLWSANIMANATIRDVMDPRSGFVCAEYF
ncbi:Di-copper centre-containing protein [Xylariaceae sp. FL1651]|nr:Di-copper centre-containing protein [Xylariaceae sp. FL1651]